MRYPVLFTSALTVPACSIAMVLGVAAAGGQTPPVFEVASVKAQPWDGQGRVGVFVRGSILDAEHVSLVDLVQFAYNLRDTLVIDHAERPSAN